MIDRRLIEQLDSTDVNTRKTAIQQLARSKDLDAIRYLEATERSDADASVRDIARKAIVYIKRHNEDAIGTGPGSASTAAKPAPEPKQKYAAGSILAEYANMPQQQTPFTDDEPMEPQDPAEPPKPKLVNVPESRVRLAKSALDMAGKAAFNEENGRATRYLVEAFKQNPNLQFDAYAVGLAATVTGLYKTDAVKAIMDASALELFDKNELKGKKKIDPADVENPVPSVGWGTAIVDLFVYGLIQAVIVGVIVIVAIQLVIQAFETDPTFKDMLTQSNVTMAQLVEQLAGYAVIGLFLYALVVGLFSILGLLVQSFFIHVIARMILGGDGRMPDLIHRTALFLGIMGSLIAIFQLAGFFLPIITNPTLGIGIWAINFFLSIYVFMGYSGRIGRVYDMGANKGCLALFLSSVVIGIVGAVCVFTLFQAQIAAIGNMFVMVNVVP